MLEKVIDYFTGKSASLNVTATGEAAEEGLQVAAAVLLLEMAGVDNDYAPEETEAIFKLLQTHFKLGEEEAVNLLELADALRQNRDKIEEFVHTINQSFESAQRERLFAAVWRVVLADGRVDAEESKYALDLKSRLQLTQEQVERAKAMAEKNQV